MSAGKCQLLSLAGNLCQSALASRGVFQGVHIGTTSIFIYSPAVARLGPIETAMFTAAVPCVTAIAAIYFLSEIPAALSLGGVVIMPIGMAVTMKNWRTENPFASLVNSVK